MRQWIMAVAVCAAVLAASASRAQTAALGDMKLTSRVVTNEQDAAGIAVAVASNAAARAALAAHAGGHGQTEGLGFAGGSNATATTGGAIGLGAAETAGGFAGGSGSAATYGGAVGQYATTTTGGAVGEGASATTGGAVGQGASATTGGAVGAGAVAGDGFAGGIGAMAAAGETPIDAIQLGTGTNPDDHTLQVYDHKLMLADGTIPVERVPWAPSWPDITNAVGWIVATNNSVVYNYFGGSITEIYVVITNLAPYAAVTGIVEWGVSPIWTVIGDHTNWHSATPQGGFWGGSNATATTGGAIGLGAAETDGGFSGGSGSAATYGGAVGLYANAATGGAVGEGASAGDGGAVGEGSVAGDGFAGGRYARAASGETPIDAIQLGTGTNPDAGTLQVYGFKLMDESGVIPEARLPAGLTNGLLSAAEAAATYLSATPGWFWQGSQAVLTNGWSATLGGYAAATNGVSSWALVPYTTSRHDVTGSVEIVSDRYIVGVGMDWYTAQPEDMSIPKTPMRTASERLGPTSWVLRAWCSVNPSDANSHYYAIASNVTVMTYDRSDMTPGLYTNDAAGIVSRVDDAPLTDKRRAVNVGTMDAYVDSRKTEIADHAWRRTPGGRDAPSAYTVTLDQPLVQQGAMAWLNSGNSYCQSYEGGDWYSATTGSVWRIGPSGTVAFEIQSTNRVLFVSGFAVAGGYATLDIATNWVAGGYAPEIEYTEDLLNQQWLACPEQTMTNMVSYWRGVCPATADTRFYRVVLRNGASLIKSHYAHEFASDIILFGQRYTSLAELKAALEALP